MALCIVRNGQSVWCYVMSGTEKAYGAMQCACHAMRVWYPYGATHVRMVQRMRGTSMGLCYPYGRMGVLTWAYAMVLPGGRAI
eukprot:377886-Rhodomonas_salina.2